MTIAIGALILVIVGMFMWAFCESMMVYIAMMSRDLLMASLQIENANLGIDNVISPKLVSDIFYLIYGVAFGLLVLKLLWKGFEIYVLWRDGDADVSPHHMLMGAVFAIVICMAFPPLYTITVETTDYVSTQIMTLIGGDDYFNVIMGADNALENASTFTVDGAEYVTWQSWFDLLDTNGDGTLTEEEANYEGKRPFDYDDLDYYLRSKWGIKLSDYGMWTDVGTLAGRINQDRVDNMPHITYRFDVKRDLSALPYIDAVPTPSPMTASDYKQIFRDLHGEGTLFDPDNMSPLHGIALFVFMIMYWIMWIKMIARGIEMMVMRVGIPLAALGLVDSDGAAFKNYIQTIFRQICTTVFQVAVMRLGVILILDMSFIGVCAGIAALTAAWRGSTLMAQLFTPQTHGTGFGAKLNTAANTVRTVRMLWKR